ncbi:MAG: tyrosine-type recombinase/integrase [Clostridia bacterium]|nr:tyrosine-type recombinase/integrase [Clostridia bacterium]
MTNNYFVERDKKNTEKVSEILKDFPSFFGDYFLFIENNSSSLTRLNYAMDLKIFFKFISKNKFGIDSQNLTYNHIEKITTTDIHSFLSYLSYYSNNGKNYKNNEKGKARKLASIRGFFKFLYNQDKIKYDVASKVTTPKIHQKNITRLEVDEVAKLINQAETADFLTKKQQGYNKLTKQRDVAILSLFLATGIRVSECVGLNLEDFDFKNNAFKVTRKGGNQTVLYFSDEVKEALAEWLEIRNLAKIQDNENAMFLSLQKKRMVVRSVENLVKKYAKAVSPLKNISPHKLRSTYGTNLYRETGDIYIVADVLGHKDVNTTKKHYAAISEDLKRNVANVVKLRK